MVYLLEDDESIRKFVVYALNSTAIETEGFERPTDFYEAIRKKLPELILLDIMLPEEDGLSILKKLKERAETKNIPVIMLTAKGTEYDKVIGLDSGADDYVAKPFGTMELISRIKAVLRRAGTKNKEEYSIGGLYVCPDKHIIRANGEDITLTLKEFELLKLLMINAGIVLRREVIMMDVWGTDYEGESRTLDMHIKTLRQKLGDAGNMIKTVRNVGYKME